MLTKIAVAYAKAPEADRTPTTAISLAKISEALTRIHRKIAVTLAASRGVFT
jgi:hypothetical protein